MSCRPLQHVQQTNLDKQAVAQLNKTLKMQLSFLREKLVLKMERVWFIFTDMPSAGCSASVERKIDYFFMIYTKVCRVYDNNMNVFVLCVC